ncbi:DUF1176 domain-containing protein [Sphingomonas sanguinis]|uniref:DUF1176 domain-containing protein n=1 Tax=Sphingomonas sp. LC-1 TaxID=3110957 RepID=UPI0021BAEAD0|nr:DUF1176 domain-containing protein [Sphingomonas sp. LC-1]MCT8000908.1 DUF1176 domain-containing protein [Sphingomonas sp. LC-1]
MIRSAAFTILAGLAMPVMAATPDTPTPARLKLFRDWIVTCDNGGGCEAASLSSEDGALQDAGLLIRRAADGTLAVKVADMTGKAKAATIRIDGRSVATVTLPEQAEGWLRGASADTLLAAMVKGRRAAILTPEVRSVSLNGATAALRYMDDRQKRAGTRGALVARGSARYRGRAPILPVVRVVTPPPGAAPAIPNAALNDMRRRLDCRNSLGSPVSAEAYRLDRRSTLVLLSCGAGAYNYLVKPLIWQGGRLAPATFDFAFPFAEEAKRGGAVTLVNSEWSPTGRLSSWGKGRGLGDCGDRQLFGWDGTRFRLLEAASMTECRGAIDTLTVWRTRPMAMAAR